MTSLTEYSSVAGAVPGEAVRNRDTSYQVLAGPAGHPMGIAHWEDGEASIVSVFVLRGAGVLAGNGQAAQRLAAGQHALYRVPSTTQATIIPQPGPDFQAVAFQFSEGYLRRHCPENCPNLCRLVMAPVVATLQPLGSGAPAATVAEQRALIAQICDTRLPTYLQSVYRDIKVAELLVLQLEEILFGNEAGGEAPLRDYELQRVYRVRDILRDNPGRRYTLLGLAHEVGTNDATLKKHFKQVLGCTVFSYLTSCRMETAKSLLASGQQTIAEIARHLGYKHVSHFSAAFRKYYGNSPTKFLESAQR